jgi:hypothetical protein
MDMLCIRCKGKGLCGKPCRILQKFKDKAPKPKLHFSGATPPEVFVGRINYPNVYSGILSPDQHGNTSAMSMPEQWVGKNLNIESILHMRGQMIYGRSIGNIKSQKSLNSVNQELALSSKPVSTEFFLKKYPKQTFSASKLFSIMANPAPMKKVTLEENPRVPQKVNYLTDDYDVKAVNAVKELYQSGINTTHLQKLLSVGLLGVKTQRKMVPTRWSITAVDDMLGKKLLEKLRYYQELNQIELWHWDYNGNHFEALLLPGSLAFEVIEVSMQGSTWSQEIGKDFDVFMQDYEGFHGRKTYATNVVGAYYANRLAISEYLDKIKKQSTILLFHEERPEYYAPLGVGIIRESLRRMFSISKPEHPASIEEALITMANRLKAPIAKYKKRSWVLANYGKQKSLKEFF